MSTLPTEPTLEANGYSICFRLLGDRPAAHAATSIAIEQLQAQPSDRPWLLDLAARAVAQSVGPASLAIDGDDDPHQGVRAALRRRLSRASDDERVAAALIHLAGYDADSVAALMSIDPADVRSLAGVIAPPPDASYRELGDPERIGERRQRNGVDSARRRTLLRRVLVSILVLGIVGAAVLGIARSSGPRPTLGPEDPTVPRAVDSTEAPISSAPATTERPEPVVPFPPGG